jgi:hypothetical protein
MGKILTTYVENQIANKQISVKHTLKIAGVDYTSYLKSAQTSYSRDFGSASAQFLLRNPDDIFGIGGESEFHIGDLVEYFQQYDGDSMIFRKFYGLIEGKPRVIDYSTRDITIVCLDYISILKNTDITLELEGNKVKIENEILEPVFFTNTGDEMFAQVFNFSTNSIAQDPPVILTIRDKSAKTDDAEFNGMDILYDVGQVKIGAPLNARDNYDLVAKSYYSYTQGVYIEEVIENIIKKATGYNTYLFNETSEENIVNNHLTSSYLEEEGLDEFGDVVNYLDYNDIAQTITISHYLTAAYNSTQLVTSTLTQDFDFSSDSVLYLDDNSSFIDPGGATTTINVAGFIMTYTGKGSGNTLTGVSGSYYIVSGATVTYDTGTPITTLTLESTDGFPASGEATIAGDVFTWTSKDATHLYGIPTSGENSLSAKPLGAYVDYVDTYAVGQVWYLLYDRITSTLTNSDFDLPSGASIYYIDHYFGRIILNSAISTSSIVKCISDYNFNTIQSTGVEINKIRFTERNTANRYDALGQCRQYLAPKYVIYTDGSDKIWGKYLYQKRVADYNVNLARVLQYFDDSDLYTRVLMFGKNKQPTNILFNEGVEFLTTGQSYKAFASNDDLVYVETKDGWHSFETAISRAGYITAEDFVPEIYINNIKVDNVAHLVVAQPVRVEKTSKTVTTTKTSKWGRTSTSQKTYYYYKVTFAHQSIYASQPIYIYSDTGELAYTISPNSSQVDYARGIWNVPGDKLNSVVEKISTATYSIFYSDNQIKIDYDNVVFYIKQTLIPDPARVLVNADYEYVHTMTPINGITRVFDGRHDTQVQTEFFSNPPTGYNYAILDLGQTYTIQAIDMIAGFYRPDDVRKFDIDMRMTLQYSLNNSDYYDITDATTNFELQGGAAKQFEESDLGDGFQARYLKLLLDNVGKIEYGKYGVWVVAFTEIAAYSDTVLRSEAKLIPITYNSNPVNSGSSTMTVVSTVGFDEPASGESVTAYIDDNAFTYTGKTSNSFTGVTIGSGESYSTGNRVTRSIKLDADVYDYGSLLYYQGDRLYKFDRTDNGVFYSQTELDNLCRAWLEEFAKNHNKSSVAVVFSPYLKVGQTVALTNPVTLVTENFFIEAINTADNYNELILAAYPD